MSMLELPPELFIQILLNLDHLSILRCCTTCKAFQGLIQSSQKLQYKIELAFDGMIDIPCTEDGFKVSTGDKLNALLSRRQSWHTLDWTHRVFAKSTAAGSMHGSRQFVMARLPSRRGEGAEIVREDVGVASRDFIIDPTQDLIGYISEHGVFPHSEIQIHLRTISTDKPHPLAAKPVIYHVCTLPFVMTNSFVAVAEDVVAIFFWIDSPGLIIWNWKTSAMIVYVTDYGQLPPGIWDFSFLSNRSFILTSRDRNGSIEIYSFENSPEDPVLNHVASLELPQLQQDIVVDLFSTHTGPFTTIPSNPEYKQSLLGEDKPFTISPLSRVHAMCVQYHIGMATDVNTERRTRFFFFVKNEYLMRLVAEHKALQAVEASKQEQADPFDLEHDVVILPEKKHVPRMLWEEWGMNNSRFMPYGMQFRWLRYVHGQKVVCPPYSISSDDDFKLCMLEVLDFNVHPKKLPEQFRNKNTNFTVHTDATLIPKGNIFVDPVVTRLPYTRATRNDMGDLYSGFMIDEERLVGLRSKTSPDGEMGDIDVFTV